MGASLDTFKTDRTDVSDNYTLSTGVRAKLKPVAPRLLDDVSHRIKDPVAPMEHNEEYDRDEPNLFDPEYNKALKDAAYERGMAQLDVLLVCGVELLEGIPPVKTWLPQLKMLEKLTKQAFLADFDLEDELDREYVYKKYIAVGNSDLLQLSKLAGLTPQEVEQAARAFPGNEERGTA